MEARIIKIGDAAYPHALLDLKNPPQQLYYKGNLQLLTHPMVAIVGTRDCTRYGLTVAKELAAKCAAAGICVVSGLAEGIDTAAHTGAGQMTIAILGNGLNVYYPMINHDLQDDIGQNSLLISEYPANFHGDKTTFPQRNRIVAALCDAVVAVEADVKSGTLITVRMAKKLNRAVFAVPGNINSYASQGTNALLANNTARMMTGPDDVLNFFGCLKHQDQPATDFHQQITFEQKTILDIVKSDEIHFDEIIEKSNYQPAQLATLLTNMEMTGLIEKLPGNFYIAKHGKRSLS